MLLLPADQPTAPQLLKEVEEPCASGIADLIAAMASAGLFAVRQQHTTRGVDLETIAACRSGYRESKSLPFRLHATSVSSPP